MANKGKIFQTVEEAVNILQKYNENFIPKRHNFKKEKIILKSVDSTVFRAFRNLNKKPSLIYRNWSSRWFDQIIDKSKGITSQKQFDLLQNELTNSLLEYWAKEVNNPSLKLTYGPASKIINLLFKSINDSEKFRTNRIQKYLHVPFDEFSLKPLRLIINELTLVDYKIGIPSNPTMRYITTPELYFIMTTAVRSLCEKANVDPIIYDYWSWNDKHK